MPAPLRITALILLAVAVTAAPALLPADTVQAQDGDTVFLRLRSGDNVVGTLVSFEDDRLVVDTEDGRLEIRAADVAPLSLYRIKSKHTGDTPDEQLDLARWCVERGLWAQARRHAEDVGASSAEHADAAAAVTAEADRGESEALLAEGRALLEAEKWDAAVEVFRRLLGDLAHTPAAVEARDLLREATDRIRAGGGAGEDDGDDGDAGPAADPDDPKLEEAMDLAADHLDAALEKKNEGLDWDSKDSSSKAERSFRDALAELDEAEELYRGVGERSRSRKRLERATAGLEEARGLRLLISMDLAHLAARVRNWNDVVTWCNEVLKIDPHHGLALELRTVVDQVRIKYSVLEKGGGGR